MGPWHLRNQNVSKGKLHLPKGCFHQSLSWVQTAGSASNSDQPGNSQFRKFVAWTFNDSFRRTAQQSRKNNLIRIQQWDCNFKQIAVKIAVLKVWIKKICAVWLAKMSKSSRGFSPLMRLQWHKATYANPARSVMERNGWIEERNNAKYT